MTTPDIRGDDQRAPTYRVDWQRPRKHRCAICVFVINEGEKVRQQLRSMMPFGGLVDIIIADGGSTDGSLDEPLMREVDAKALLVKTGPGKLCAQMRMPMDYCMTEEYDGVIVIDGNGKDGLEAIPTFAELWSRAGITCRGLVSFPVATTKTLHFPATSQSISCMLLSFLWHPAFTIRIPPTDSVPTSANCCLILRSTSSGHVSTASSFTTTLPSRR